MERNYGCPHHVNHLYCDLDKLTLSMNLLREKKKEQLWDMTNAATRHGVGRNYIFSKLGRYIMKAQLAYFHSEPLSPLVDGLQQSDTYHMLSFFESSQKTPYHVLRDIPLPDTVGQGSPMA